MPIRRRGMQFRQHAAPRRAAMTALERRHERFERLVQRALDTLPAHVQPLLENVAIVVEDDPSDEQRQRNGLGPDDTLYGLYEGTPAVEYGADWVPFPNKITLFRLPLEEDFADPRELEEQVRRTVLHELAHHAGIGDERLEGYGLD